VIFFDEIDSMLTKRQSSGENEAARRLKTEFLVQVDGCGNDGGQVLVIGATNRPFDLDEAALRRLTKRIYIDLPDGEARVGAILKLVNQVNSKLSEKDLKELKTLTKGYSFADINAVTKDAAMGPIRELKQIHNATKESLRAVNIQDFRDALKKF